MMAREEIFGRLLWCDGVHDAGVGSFYVCGHEGRMRFDEGIGRRKDAKLVVDAAELCALRGKIGMLRSGETECSKQVLENNKVLTSVGWVVI